MAVPSGLSSRWKRLARKAAEAQSNVLLFLLYYLVVVPLALVRRPFTDPLRRKPSSAAGWRARPSTKADLESARRQF